jgi:pimeloyl-ACP methyl ester carboxylesterase
MATYVLVHGAWGSGRGYRRTAARLRADGHHVHVVTLTGLGERQHLASPAIDLSLHIRDVMGVIETEALTDIILVGHSYGGMVITGVTALAAERIRSLVYVDAFLPKAGQSLWDLVDETTRRHFIETQRDHPGFVAPLPDPPGAPPRPRSPHPFASLVEPVRLTGREASIERRTYVYADGGLPTAFDRFRDALAGDPDWRLVSLPSGHMVMIDNPDGLHAVLAAEA